MKIDFSKLAEGYHHSSTDWRYHFLLETMTTHTANPEKWKDSFGIDMSKRPLVVDVVVTINGVEIDFNKWMELAETSYSRMVNEHAKELVAEKTGEMMQKLNRLSDELQIMVEDTTTKNTTW